MLRGPQPERIVNETDPLPKHHHQAAVRKQALRRSAQHRHGQFYSRWPGWSFMHSLAAVPVSWRREHWMIGGVVAALTLMVGVVLPGWAGATRHDSSLAYTTLELPLPPSLLDTADATIDALALAAADEPEWHVVVVQPGQTLSDIFQAQGLGTSLLHRVLQSVDDDTVLRRIHPGDEFAFLVDGDGILRGLRFDRDEATRLTLNISDDGIDPVTEERALERRTRLAHGQIRHSLFDAGAQAGINDTMVLQLAKAFGYDIDFAQDLRTGDRFSVIYDEVYRDGERLRNGDILAATFINRGKRYTAIRHVNSDGDVMYYNEEGRPLRTDFLRTPVEFTRISSKFTSGRMHPVLGRMRAHRGVDYAAPTGTPIRAAGDGKIIFRGKQNGYGNVVIVQHQGKYTTLYAHMSRFAKNHVGERVRQGQTIGYVGMTGLATGPHLHYEFRVNGKHQDPLSVTLPKPEPLPASELVQFQRSNAPLLAKLRQLEGVMLAQASP